MGVVRTSCRTPFLGRAGSLCANGFTRITRLHVCNGIAMFGAAIGGTALSFCPCGVQQHKHCACGSPAKCHKQICTHHMVSLSSGDREGAGSSQRQSPARWTSPCTVWKPLVTCELAINLRATAGGCSVLGAAPVCGEGMHTARFPAAKCTPRDFPRRSARRRFSAAKEVRRRMPCAA